MKNCAGFCVRHKLSGLISLCLLIGPELTGQTDERMLLIALRVPTFVGLTLGLFRPLFFCFLTNGRQSEQKFESIKGQDVEIDLVTVLEAILTSWQAPEKLVFA